MYLLKDYSKLIIAAPGNAGTPVIIDKYSLVKDKCEDLSKPQYVTYADLTNILNKFKEDLLNAPDESNSNVHQSSTPGNSK